MSKAALPEYWLEKYQFSNDVQTLFMWRRGLFGFKLRGEIKRKLDQVSRLIEQQEFAESEHNDLTVQLKAVQRRMERLAKKSDSGSSAEADKLDLEFAQLQGASDVKVGAKVNINNELTKAKNDLKLMNAYLVNQIRTADEAQREWTGRESTYNPDRTRGNLPDPREMVNRFQNTDSLDEKAVTTPEVVETESSDSKGTSEE